MAWEPSWGTHPETGEPCIAWTRHVEENIANSQRALNWEHRALTMVGDPRLRDVEHLYCNHRGEDDPAPAVESFARSIPLPAIEARIPPGYAITGMLAYLIIDNQDGFEVTEPWGGLGTLEVSLAPAAFEVDWGDGRVEVVDDGRTGVPYDGPEDQQIRHAYRDRNPDNVVRITAHWQATWRVGGFTGTVGGLQVTEEFDFPVREYRSVRTAP